jgi:hypothetical protein
MPQIASDLSQVELESPEKNVFVKPPQKSVTLSNQDPYADLKSAREQTIGRILFRMPINIVETGTCPKVSSDPGHGTMICLELERVSGFPKEEQFKKSLEILVDLAGELNGLSQKDRVLLNKEFSKKLGSYVTYLEPQATYSIIRKQLELAIRSIDELGLKGSVDRASADKFIHHLTYEIPNAMYPLFFRGALGKEFPKFESAMKLAQLAWIQVYIDFVEPAISAENSNQLIDYALDDRYIYYASRLSLTRNRNQPKASLLKSKTFLEQALQELNKNFPE